MLGVEGVVVEGGGSHGAKLVQLEAADLAHEPLAGAVLLAAHAEEEVREVEPGQPVLRVAEMHHLAVTAIAAVFWLVLLRLALARLGKSAIFRRQLAAEVSRVHGHAPAHVARSRVHTYFGHLCLRPYMEGRKLEREASPWTMVLLLH